MQSAPFVPSVVSTDKPLLVDEAVDAVLTRRGTDPTLLLQILIETQERLSWLPPHALSRIAAALNLPRAACRGRRKLLQLPRLASGRPLPSAFRRQHHRGDAGKPRAHARFVPEALARARKALRGQSRQRRRHLLHRHERSGTVLARQWHAGHAAHAAADRRDRNLGPRSNSVGSLAAGVFCRGRQRPSARHPAFERVSSRARRCARPSRKGPTRSWPKSSVRAFAGAAARASLRRANGSSAGRRPRMSRAGGSSSATPTKASPARSRIACC